METIFSKIIAKEIPADIVYEDDQVLAFLDIKPVNMGHTLVIPKKPVIDGVEASFETMAQVMKVAQIIARAQKAVLGCSGVNYIMNNGADAGQEVFHAHLHVVPRYKDDHRFKPVERTEYNKVRSTETADALSSAINS